MKRRRAARLPVYHHASICTPVGQALAFVLVVLAADLADEVVAPMRVGDEAAQDRPAEEPVAQGDLRRQGELVEVAAGAGDAV